MAASGQLCVGSILNEPGIGLAVAQEAQLIAHDPTLAPVVGVHRTAIDRSLTFGAVRGLHIDVRVSRHAAGQEAEHHQGVTEQWRESVSYMKLLHRFCSARDSQVVDDSYSLSFCPE